eukprot:8133141-Pyramimonas_sp.AAC.1
MFTWKGCEEVEIGGAGLAHRSAGADRVTLVWFADVAVDQHGVAGVARDRVVVADRVFVSRHLLVFALAELAVEEARPLPLESAGWLLAGVLRWRCCWCNVAASVGCLRWFCWHCC